MRKKIAAANWKMNTTVKEGIALLEKLKNRPLARDVDVLIHAPFTHLYEINQQLHNSFFYLGAQDVSAHVKGAYTGEVSPDMLKACGVSHVIIGHSERREHHNESNSLLADKLKNTLDHGLVPVFCCGEALQIRKSKQQVDFVINQLKESFSSFTAKDLSTLIIAYEPIWAIGTGETASPAQAQDMHSHIRQFIASEFGDSMADKVPILYGGSVKAGNASELFSQPDVDGGLVGGASLDAEQFGVIINSFS